MYSNSEANASELLECFQGMFFLTTEFKISIKSQNSVLSVAKVLNNLKAYIPFNLTMNIPSVMNTINLR